MTRPRPAKPCFFVGTSRRDLVACPEQVRADMGHALYEVQCGGEPVSAKALKGFGSRSVLEIVDDFDGDTFRAVYSVRFPAAVYVLHVFKKKSKKGAATPKREIDLVMSRLKDAEEHYRVVVAAGEKSR
jgi:phage-related protein